MLTTVQAAARLGLSPRQVRHLAAQGRIKGAQKLGRDWVFDAKAVAPKRLGLPQLTALTE